MFSWSRCWIFDIPVTHCLSSAGDLMGYQILGAVLSYKIGSFFHRRCARTYLATCELSRQICCQSPSGCQNSSLTSIFSAALIKICGQNILAQSPYFSAIIPISKLRIIQALSSKIETDQAGMIIHQSLNIFTGSTHPKPMLL